MKKSFLAIMLTAALFTACSKTGDANTIPGGSNAGSVEKNRIKGTVKDSKGNPLANIKIVVEHTLYYATYVYAMSDANGYYTASVPNGSWKASALIQKDYLGNQYSFDLHPDVDAAFAGTDGGVRNFTWQLNGNKPGGGFYGSTVAVYSEPGAAFMPEDIVLTLTPDGPLADGSNGQIITKGLSDVGGGEDGITDVPVGKYNIRASLKTNGQPLQIRIRNTGNYNNTVEGIFKPGYTGSTHYRVVVQVK